jgi:hypothetical protein
MKTGSAILAGQAPGRNSKIVFPPFTIAHLSGNSRKM